MGRRRSRSGFTLIEIVLVMMIIAVLSGAVMTNLHGGYQSLALESDAKLLAEVIQAGQRYARTNRRVCRLLIEPVHNEYRLLQAATIDRPFLPVEGLESAHALDRSLAFHEVRKLKAGDGAHEHIHFFPDGTCEAAQIVLASESGEERVLEIEELAGPPAVGHSQ